MSTENHMSTCRIAPRTDNANLSHDDWWSQVVEDAERLRQYLKTRGTRYVDIQESAADGTVTLVRLHPDGHREVADA